MQSIKKNGGNLLIVDGDRQGIYPKSGINAKLLNGVVRVNAKGDSYKFTALDSPVCDTPEQVLHTLFSYLSTSDISTNLAGAKRMSQITTLFDGKVLNTEDTDIWETVGNGTATFVDNRVTMAVTAGQYLVRQSKRRMPYFSGKVQVVELTFDNFHHQANVTKRAAYMASSPVAPYTASPDGFILEQTANGPVFRIYYNGTLKKEVPFADWVGYEQLKDYDWQSFTVCQLEYLWLGGVGAKLWIVVNGEFILALEIPYAGTEQGPFTQSPNLHVRYEIRSTTGNGTMTAICSQVGSEGSIEESGKPITWYNNAAVACNSVGTIYALLGVKKVAAQRDISTKIMSMGVANTASADAGLLMLFINPTLSAPLSYANYSRFSAARATNQTITANSGRALYGIPIGQDGQSYKFDNDYLTWLSQGIADTFDEFVVGYMPTTSNQSVSATLNLKEFF